MSGISRKRLRGGALVLALSAILFLAFQLSHPVSSLALTDPEATARNFGSSAFLLTEMALIVSFTILPLAILTLYAFLSDSGAERWMFAATIFILLSLVPFALFTGLGVFGFSAASMVILEGSPDAINVLRRMIEGPGLVSGIVGIALLVVGAVLLAVAVWRSQMLPRWGGIMYALGFILFIVAVSSPIEVQRTARIIDGLLGCLGGLSLAWGIWRAADTRASPLARDDHRA